MTSVDESALALQGRHPGADTSLEKAINGLARALMSVADGIGRAGYWLYELADEQRYKRLVRHGIYVIDSNGQYELRKQSRWYGYDIMHEPSPDGLNWTVRNEGEAHVIGTFASADDAKDHLGKILRDQKAKDPTQ